MGWRRRCKARGRNAVACEKGSSPPIGDVAAADVTVRMGEREREGEREGGEREIVKGRREERGEGEYLGRWRCKLCVGVLRRRGVEVPSGRGRVAHIVAIYLCQTVIHQTTSVHCEYGECIEWWMCMYKLMGVDAYSWYGCMQKLGGC